MASSGFHFDTFIDQLADAVADRVITRIGKGAALSSSGRLLTVKQTAECIGRTQDATYQLIARGRLAAVREGRRVHVERSELDAFIERGRTE